MVIEIILGVSAVFNIGLLIVVRYLLKQNEQLEDDLVGTINGVVQTITDANQRMEQADLRGSFESDDEVGTVFTELNGIVKDLNDNEMSMPLLDNSDNTVQKYKILKEKYNELVDLLGAKLNGGKALELYTELLKSI